VRYGVPNFSNGRTCDSIVGRLVDTCHIWRQNPVVDKTTLYLTPELRRRLHEVARRTGRPQAEVIRSALDAYLGETLATRPQSIGAGEDGTLQAGDTERWLRERWRDR
jgi:predicted transcriptional regulator